MKLYVLVRKDLHPSQQAVQCGHAVAQWVMENYNDEIKNNVWENGTLVYLGVNSKLELKDYFDMFKIGSTSPFYEEYFNNEMTAFAVLGTDDVRAAVKDLKLI